MGSHQLLRTQIHRKTKSLHEHAWLQVYKGRFHQALVAVKVLPYEGAPEDQEVLQEIAILEGLRHPNVVTYMNHFLNEAHQVLS